MKAAVYCGPHDIQVADVPKPEINANEILVRVKACGSVGRICTFIASDYLKNL